MNKKHYSLITLLIGIIASPLIVAKNDFLAINRYVNATKKEIGLPSGTAVAIVKDGKIIYEGYFGYANIKAKKPVTNQTAFYIASITKPLFALSTLLLEHKGDIKESSTLKAMFPKQRFPYIDANEINLQHLLTHTSGLQNWPFVATLAYTGNHDFHKRHALLDATTYSDSRKLGEYDYSNLGYNIASVWMEDTYKQDWQKTLSELVYKPLKMNHTSSYMTDVDALPLDVARPYSVNKKNLSDINDFEKNNKTMHAAGGTNSTAHDLARFLIAQLNNGNVDGEQIFPSDVIKKSQKVIAKNDLRYRSFKRTGYAWGWYTGPFKNEEMHHHFGGVSGTHSHASFMLKHNIGVVVLNNESEMSSKLTNGIADIAYSILLNKSDSSKLADRHIKEMQHAWRKIKPKLEASRAKFEKEKASRVMTLTQERSLYSGTYHHPLWGNLIIEEQANGEFKFVLGALRAIATPYTKQDTMRVEFSALGQGEVAQFEVSNKNIVSVSVMNTTFKKIDYSKSSL